MVRVTSDVTASTSYQAAQQKPARFDPSQGFDSFGSLVDSSIPPPPPSAPAQAPPPRPSDGATTDRSAPSDPAPDQSAPSHQTDPSGQAAPSDPPAAANPSGTKADASSPSDGKAADGKSSDGKAAETKSSNKSTKGSASGEVSATDATTVAQPNIPALTTQDPVAVVIPVTIAPAGAPIAAPTPDATPKPLAIAAAALATATAAAAATGSAASVAPEAAATTVNPAADPGTTPIASGKISAQAATILVSAKPSASTPVPGPATEKSAVTDTTDVALAAAISGPPTIGGKTASAKGAPETQVKTQATSDGITSNPTKTAATTEPGLNGAGSQPAPAAKPDAVLAAAAEAKPEVSSATATTTDAVIPRGHGSASDSAPTPPANTDASLQIPATFQPQAPTTMTPPLSPANLTATAATGAPVPLSGLAVEIAAAAHSGKTSFDVRLDPADLGRIDVRIDVDRNGQVTSHLRVEKPETLTLLQQDAPQLRQALDDAGLKTGTGGLQFSLRDQSSSGQNNGNQSGGNAQRLVVSEDDTVPVAVAGRSYGRMLTSNGGVDIRV